MENEAAVIIEALRTGSFFLSVHAARRMRHRSVSKADIQNCGRTVRSSLNQAKKSTWRIVGQDLDGEILTVICGMDNGVVVVTIY